MQRERKHDSEGSDGRKRPNVHGLRCVLTDYQPNSDTKPMSIIIIDLYLLLSLMHVFLTYVIGEVSCIEAFDA
jgi:hypothetical protein